MQECRPKVYEDWLTRRNPFTMRPAIAALEVVSRNGAASPQP